MITSPLFSFTAANKKVNTDVLMSTFRTVPDKKNQFMIAWGTVAQLYEKEKLAVKLNHYVK